MYDFAGQWPTEGPKPSKLAVLFFYLSVIFTVIGIIIVIRSAFYVEVCDREIFIQGEGYFAACAVVNQL